MHPKHKGSVAELLACAWLLKQGYEVFRNVSQNGHADLVVWTADEAPMLVEVRKLYYRIASDGTCGAVAHKNARHPQVRLLYANMDTGDCCFDHPSNLIAAMGYTVRTPPSPVRRFCLVEDCGRKHHARGFCQFHHHRWWRGDSSLIPQP